MTYRNENNDIKCRHGCDNPIGIFHVPDGCLCHLDPVQALCAQHLDRITTDGPVRIIVDFRVDFLNGA